MTTKYKKYLKGWQALLIADALLVLALFSYSLPNALAFVVLIFAIIIGIVNLAKKRTKTIGLDLSMTFIAGILYSVLSAVAYSNAFPA